VCYPEAIRHENPGMIGFILIVLAALPPGASCGADEPAIAVAMLSGLGPSPSGLVAAVWSDGRILRAKVPADPSQGYVEARLLAAQVAALDRLISESGIWSWKQPGMPLDFPEDLISVCGAGRRASFRDTPGMRKASPQRRLTEYLLELPVDALRAIEEPGPQVWIRWFRRTPDRTESK
jgi:hypothetical protein